MKKILPIPSVIYLVSGIDFLSTKKIISTTNSWKELVEKINAEIALFQENANLQVTKGNKAAGTRARKNALNISNLMKEFRKASVEAAKN